jgi:hypothetical protein
MDSPPLTRDYMEKLFVEMDMTPYEIADYTKTNPKVIQKLLVEYGFLSLETSRLLRDDGSVSMRGDLDLAGRDIINVREIIAATDALLQIRNLETLDRDLGMGNHKIVDLATPSNPLDGANKSYVDALIAALSGTLLDLQFKGEWYPITPYDPGNVVYHSGALYVCLTDNTNNEPTGGPEDIYWSALEQLGGVGIIVRGDYDAETDYNIRDAVKYEGSFYYCYVPCSGILPTDTNKWKSIVSKGDTGATGQAATIAVGTTSTLAAGSPVTVQNSGTSQSAVFDFGIPQGIKGDRGFTMIGPYDVDHNYAKDDGASYGGSTWISKHADNSGNALVEGEHWTILAEKGQDGVGTGDVIGPGSSTDARIALFNGLTGKLLKESSVGVSDLAPSSKGVTNGDLHDHNGGDGNQIDHGGLGGLGDDDHSQYATNTNHKIRHIEFIIDGGGSAIVAGSKGTLRIGYACTIKKATLIAETSGSIVVDIWKTTYTAYDDSTHPVDADSITASAPMTVTTAVKSKNETLTGWTTAIAADSILRFNVDSCTSITRCTVDLEVEVTR